MAYVKKLFEDNFLQYASYVIKDRAIPDLDDGLKPVQRRILHSLFEMDDGKFHKVANVVGHCMKYHPHGDASIYSALVVLANKDLFIDKQGNFGNVSTGDEASAARYIECRITPFAREILYHPKITEYADSYDGRNREPVAFPAKIPLVLLTGAEGIAVGMSTKILPHNPLEVIKAEIACLSGKRFKLTPDFPTGGFIDPAEYADGNGKVRVRAKLDSSDPKRILIRELPAGSTTESLIASVEAAAKSGRLKIAGISDFTTDKVEIEIKLARGVYAEETIDALYALTECEQSISCNLLVIKDGIPTVMTVTDVVKHHAEQLLGVLKRELELEAREILDEIHARTLERIFIEERVYKSIEKMKTQETVLSAVFSGFKPFSKEIKREVTNDDVERLLKIPIRRISLYDINKAKDEMDRLKGRLREIKAHLSDLTSYAVAFLQGVAKKLEKDWKRKTEIQEFHTVNVREVVRKDISVRYDAASGYVGTQVSGELLATVSPYERLLIIRKNGVYSIADIPEKLFVDAGLAFCEVTDKESVGTNVFTIIYKDKETGHPYVKRCSIETYVPNRDYTIIPDGCEIVFMTVAPKGKILVEYVKAPRMKVKEETVSIADTEVKGLKAAGTRIGNKPVATASLVESAAARAEREAPLPVKKAGSGKPAAKAKVGKSKTAKAAESAKKSASGAKSGKTGKK